MGVARAAARHFAPLLLTRLVHRHPWAGMPLRPGGEMAEARASCDRGEWGSGMCCAGGHDSTP
ncbi:MULTISPECIES: hypothetical protein [unclassified Rhodococcus (in: high G+C Gram-positive bacteria)]|uniref:hypothetical protein n=1 Tax=unclassified Rhodococcus (in: high G+C Gram-positive bacteria) TaxID=192944 RepID=UPI0012E810A6|nr:MULTISPECIES: hypothetical protein [unclassified Rhodococcus (in: high G+C Gram-positive bacteria)]